MFYTTQDTEIKPTWLSAESGVDWLPSRHEFHQQASPNLPLYTPLSHPSAVPRPSPPCHTIYGIKQITKHAHVLFHWPQVTTSLASYHQTETMGTISAGTLKAMCSSCCPTVSKYWRNKHSILSTDYNHCRQKNTAKFSRCPMPSCNFS